MVRGLVARLALLSAGACVIGSGAGFALADYVQSGAFAFYRQSQLAEWRSDPTQQPASLPMEWKVAGEDTIPAPSFASYEH